MIVSNQTDLLEHLTENSQQFVSQESKNFLRTFEGQCKIKEYSTLAINYAKIVFLLIPFAATIIGLLLIYHYKRLRVKLAFSVLYQPKDFYKATHIYAKGESGVDSICPIYTVNTIGKQFILFRFQQLIYELKKDQFIPLGMDLRQSVRKYLSHDKWKEGLLAKELQESKELYGLNQHLVKIPSYHQYLFDSLTSLKISIIYLNMVITFIQYPPLYSLLLIILSLIAIHINYFLTRNFYKKIKKIAEKQYKIKVIRDGIEKEVLNSDLVPGDVYLIQSEIPCDSIILKGSAFVNEVSFTGENIPVVKCALQEVEKLFDSQHWVYQGCTIVSQKSHTYALVVNTAFTTRKGKILRKILHSTPNPSDYLRSMLPFMILAIFVHLAMFGCFYHYMFSHIHNNTIIYLRFGQFLITSIPGFLMIEESFFKSIYLLKFNKNNIIVTDFQKTTEGSRLETIYFDKTGTLTENTVKIESVLVPNQQSEWIRNQSIQSNNLLLKLFSTCHSIQQFNGKLSGDQIDLKMFLATNSILKAGEIDDHIVFQVETSTNKLEVHKIHQFQSKFQSMSVLVKDKQTGQMFVFAKGSPQKLQSLSQMKYPHFSKLIKELSLQGYRSIAVSFKKIESQAEFKEMSVCDREVCLKGTTLIGLVTFSNKVKEDAFQSIKILKEADITPKIVTGDNIFVAIQTALYLQIVPFRSKIIALEGKNIEADGSIQTISITRVGDKIKEQEAQYRSLSHIQSQDFIAVDLDFIKLNQQFIANRNNCIVFARATPEFKAVIINIEKEKIRQQYCSRKWVSRIFGSRIGKVGMVGDGANDLMAIREANIGMAISNSDAVYSADFTIESLRQVELIVRESKSGEQKLLQLTQFYYIYHFLDLVCKILQTPDSSLNPPNVGLIRNFLTETALCIVIAFGQTGNKLSRHSPLFNMLSLSNQLTYWVSSFIGALAMTATYYYYRSTSFFQPNPNTDKLGWRNQTATVTILVNIIFALFISVSVIQSNPWKQKIWRNIPMTFFLTANLVFATVATFFTKELSSLNLTGIDEIEALKIYLMSIGFGMVCFLFNSWVQSRRFYEKQ